GETDDLVGGRDTASNSCTPNPDGEVRGVDSYLELGLRGSYQLSDATSISAGIINLLDEEPPFSELAAGGWPFFDQALYDPRGTRFYLNVSHDFR
ncbi:MAG: TonB-dependent receptor, partial [Gammaproteobacteria bacterium]|nr:TonB-dependent receptor [Gammaproteobacteria bacterium]NNF60879.1 TonB-dependent receptor [Gammaproteobacteria bacterium]